MSGQRVLRVCSFGVAAALALALAAGGAAAAADERATLAADRAVVEARFEAEAAACWRRFAVNDCLDRARAGRRAALEPLREREFTLDEVRRRARAAEREAAIAARQQAATREQAARAERAERLEQARRQAESALPSEPLLGRTTPRSPEDLAAAGARRQEDAELRAAEAAERAAAAQRRQQRAEEAAARLQARLAAQAERAARGRASQPLPMPADLQGSD